RESGTPMTSVLPFLLLGVALLIALGFEFVNGFHDTANAVATVIYTHSLPAPVAVVWMKLIIRKPALYSEPKGKSAPPWWIRGLLIFTSAGVSFAHGSNDGQKGMGLIMLILIGTVPTAYALNRTPSAGDLPTFVRNSL